MKILFVGGPVDGEWREVQVKNPHLQIYVSVIHKVSDKDIIVVSKEKTTGNTEIYKLLPVRGIEKDNSETLFEAYVHASLSGADLMRRLFGYYRPSQNCC